MGPSGVIWINISFIKIAGNHRFPEAKNIVFIGFKKFYSTKAIETCLFILKKLKIFEARKTFFYIFLCVVKN